MCNGVSEAVINNPRRLAALEALLDRGAHYVLAAPGKRPLQSGWQKTPPDFEAVRYHIAKGGLVGVIPASLGAVVIDVDEGGPGGVQSVIQTLKPAEPVTTSKTQREGGAHIWYRASSRGTGNRKWALDGASGDIRGSAGFVILWDPAHVADGFARFFEECRAPNLAKLPKPRTNETHGPAAVLEAPVGARNETLNRGAFIAAKAGNFDRKAFRKAALQSGLSLAEIAATLASAESAGTKAVEAEALSEGSFAREWATRLNKDAYLYAAGEGWLRFEGGRWHDGACTARKTMSELIRVRVVGTKEAKRFDCHRVVCGALAMAEYERTVPVDSFDAKRLHIPFADGTLLDVETWQRNPAGPRDRIRKSLAVMPSSTPSRLWTRFVYEALSHYPQGEREEVACYLQEWCGLALTGDCRDEAALFLWGDPGSGKSTFFETLLAVMGSLGAAVSGKRVAGDREDHRQWIAALQGKRLVVINELPERGRWNSEDLNALIDGGPIEANRMRHDSIVFGSQAHLLITGNHRPNASASSGIWRRLRQIEFRHKPEFPDVSLKLKLRQQLPWVLAWCLEGLERWHERGWLPNVPAMVAAGVERYRAEADPIAQFVSECTAADDNGMIEVGVLYEAFSAWWTAEVSEQAPAKRTFGRALDDLGWPPSIVLSGKRQRVGYRLTVGNVTT